ncbi:MAG TPA: DUF5073 family protein [Mycobacteriales bacterium]|nr:DUF5073 family protein [Mycobacteriales bacterium]
MTGGVFDPEHARAVLQEVLEQPGGGRTVIEQLSGLPGATFSAAEPKRLLRAGRPARLVLGDQAFSEPDARAATQLQVSHVVRDVTLQTRVLGPADAAAALVDALGQLLAAGGPDTLDAIDAALYGLEHASG